jgi:hypothetical protein
MTDDESSNQPTPYNPASMPASSLGSIKAVWYKRPWFLTTAAVIVVVAVSVVTDLPHPISKAEDASSQNASIKQINADTKACVFAVKEVFSFYTKQVTGKLSAANRTQAITLLVNDQTACSFASNGLSDLTNNLQVNLTSAGKYIVSMAKSDQMWMTGYALAAIEDIQYLFVHPANQKKIADLTIQQVRLSATRQKALADLAHAEALVAPWKLSQGELPVLAHLPGT